VTVAILIAIVTFVVSEAEQAEANLASQHAVVQDKSRLLEMANRQLEMADRYKSHFLASASHDLRQPLSSVGRSRPCQRRGRWRTTGSDHLRPSSR
jgi:signal transduction histidine kinase